MNTQDKYNILKEQGLQPSSKFYDSQEYLDMLFTSPLNYNSGAFENKINIFCPYFLELTSLMINPNVAEWISGFGVFLTTFKQINPTANLFYVNSQGNSMNLAKMVLEDYNCEFLEKSTNQMFDIVFSDGVFNLFDDLTIRENINKITNSINKDGVFYLLLNLDTLSLRKYFDTRWIHDLIQENRMICVWGKYTFSSMWIKI